MLYTIITCLKVLDICNITFFYYVSAQMVGLDVLHSQSLSGEQLDSMPDDELDRIIDTVIIMHLYHYYSL